MAKKISDLAAAAALDGTELSETVQGGANVKFPLGAVTPPGYVDGLKMQWVSATALTITSGAAYIPSLGRVLRVSASIAKAGLVLTASTWYHVYLWLNGASADVEIVTTAPAAPYVGTARTKNSDTSRRYLGSVKTDTTGALIMFDHTPSIGMYHYKHNINADGLFVLSNGGSASQVVIDVSAVVPPTAVRAVAYMENSDVSNIAYIGTPDIDVKANVVTFMRANSRLSSMYLLSNQQMAYVMQSASAAGTGLNIWIQGYIYER
jgi:hypothetical protein